MPYKLTLKKKDTRPSYLTVTHRKTANEYKKSFGKIGKVKVEKVSF